MNDTHRGQWIDKDEGLYQWHRRSGMSKRRFIRQHRKELDRMIANMLSNRTTFVPRRATPI